MVSAFSHPDMFIFLNLQDSGKAGNSSHEGKQIDQVLETLKPVSQQFYNHSESIRWGLSIRQGSTCYQKRGTQPSFHYSWHGSQFWAIQKCWQMVMDYEMENSFRYEYFVRARPDIEYPQELKHAIQTVTSSHSGFGKHAWIRKGTLSDTFALLSRDAADSYADTFKNTFLNNSCVHLPSQNSCRPIRSTGMSDLSTAIFYRFNECLLYRNMLSGGVDVHFDVGLPLCRPVRPQDDYDGYLGRVTNMPMPCRDPRLPCP
jgi:hypothetical protein